MKRPAVFSTALILTITACALFNPAAREVDIRETVDAAIASTQSRQAATALPVAATPIVMLAPTTTPIPPVPPFTPAIIFQNAGEIWRMKPDGSEAILVSTHGWDATYSPDNSMIAVSDASGSEPGIWIANADGTNFRQVSTFGHEPDWSPDDSKLVFHRDEEEPGQVSDRHLWMVNVDGSDLHRLAESHGGFPRWSPVNDTIIFHGEINRGIWVIDPDGTHEWMLYDRGGYPDWSPNGQKVAYVSLDDWCIWIMDADGSGRHQLTSNKGLTPIWSDDGSQIVYEGMDGGIWVVNADGSNSHVIQESGTNPDWSNPAN